jgi:hypothetical protein
MTLPPFVPPTLAELREWYRRYRSNEDVRRLVLEVQHARTRLAELTQLLGKVERAARRADFGRLTNDDAPLRDASEIVWAEMLRAGLVRQSAVPRRPPRSLRGAAAFDFDPDEADERKAEEAARLIAKAHKRC